jgi:hypothetical protein
MDWSAEAEKTLYCAILEYGLEQHIPWQQIASLFPDKSIESCEAHWNEFRQRGILKGNWSPKEDSIIFSAVQKVS